MKLRWMVENLRRCVRPETRAGWRYFLKAAFLRERTDGTWGGLF